MTPLMPAPQPSAVPALPGSGSARGAPPAAGGKSFAAALEQGQAGPVGDLADTPGEIESPADMPAEAAVPDGTGGEQAHLLQQPPPPWPPAGLAGLAFSAAGGGDGAEPLPAMATFARMAAGGNGDASNPALGLPGFGTVAAMGPEATRVAGDGDGNPPLATFALPPLPSSSPVQEAAPMLETPLPAPGVRAQDFSERFGAQLHWMANEGIGHARIRVSPQELGPVEVMLRLDGERISADFISAHAETRQALEHGLPRLRDLLGEHGFQLAHAGVGQDAPASQDDRAPAAPGGTHAHDGDDAASDVPGQVALSSRLLDAYA